MISIEKLNVGWERCKVYDDINIYYAALNVNNIGHKAINCKNDDVCIKCLKNHRTVDCSSEAINKCGNCIKTDETRP